jgi:cytochrome bd-type quinol oxidase subunit 1
MNYPVWDIPFLGGGMLIGLVAIIHTFVSQFAIGGGLYLVLTERKAYREKDVKIIDYVKLHSKFFILLTLVFGAISGVAIWFTIGLVSPMATSSLIHIFVWGWAIEWIFFFIEIAAALIYYKTWDTLDRTTHLTIGWIYFIAAWMSLFVINGILSFMLTPGAWLTTKSFWDAFFNPTMLPSLVMRSAVTLALAGLYALLTASSLKDQELRTKMIKYSSKWLIIPFFVLPIAGLWYALMIPQMALDIISGGAPAVTLFAAAGVGFSVLVFGFAYFLPYRHPDRFPTALAVMFLVLGLMVTGVSEWVREAIRKPYVIYNYLYSNNVFEYEKDNYRTNGILQNSKWVNVKSVETADTSMNEQKQLKAGAELFRLQCQSCHTIQGYNGIKIMVKGWQQPFIADQLKHLNQLKGFMPPFMGSDSERKALANWLYDLNREKGEMK